MTVKRTSARVGFIWLEQLWQDVKYGCRMLASSPVFTVVAVLSLAIGIGANCAIFSFADALLLRPLPVARPGEVVTVGSTASLEALSASSLVSSYPDYVDIRDQQQELRRTGRVHACHRRLHERSEGAAEIEDGHAGQRQPVLADGRRADHRPRVHGPTSIACPAATPSSCSAARMWEQEFGSDRAVLGRAVRINGHDFTVIGVAPPAFTGMNQYVRADFFVPLMMSARLLSDPKAGSLQARDARNLTLKGRLAAGVSQAQAQTELTSIARQSRAGASRHEQESRSRRAHRAAGEDGAEPAGRHADRDALDARRSRSSSSPARTSPGC